MVRPALLVLWLAFCGGARAAEPPPNTLAQRLVACSVCHGDQGRASSAGYLPRIAGKPAGYLVHQLLNFRDGRRHNTAMAYLVEHLSDAYLREIAEHFAALNPPYPPPAPSTATPAQLARGQALVQRGDAARGVPACTACHGETMTGVLPAMPGLLGLPRDYLIGQLGAWKTGQRRAHAPDCMAQLVQRMSDDDISAVTAWLAAQPVPPAPHAVAAGASQPLPLACGSAR